MCTAGPWPHPTPPTSSPLQAWYTEEDLLVGAVLDLHGRRFRLTLADAFTEQYHETKGQAP